MTDINTTHVTVAGLSVAAGWELMRRSAPAVFRFVRRVFTRKVEDDARVRAEQVRAEKAVEVAKIHKEETLELADRTGQHQLAKSLVDRLLDRIDRIEQEVRECRDERDGFRDYCESAKRQLEEAAERAERAEQRAESAERRAEAAESAHADCAARDARLSALERELRDVRTSIATGR